MTLCTPCKNEVFCVSGAEKLCELQAALANSGIEAERRALLLECALSGQMSAEEIARNQAAGELPIHMLDEPNDAALTNAYAEGRKDEREEMQARISVLEAALAALLKDVDFTASVAGWSDNTGRNQARAALAQGVKA